MTKSLEALERILKLIASGKLPKELYDEYLSDTEIGFKNFQDLKECFNLERLELLENENQELRDKLNSQDLDIWQLHEKYGIYKKAIEILSNYICVRNPLDEEDTYYLSALFSNEEIDKRTHNLLKEVLNND